MVSPFLSETTLIPTLVTGRSSCARMASISRFRAGMVELLVMNSSVSEGDAASPAKVVTGQHVAMMREESNAPMILLRCGIQFSSGVGGDFAAWGSIGGV